MSDSDATQVSSKVYGNNVADTGSIYVPAEVQREQGIAIGDEIEVTISGIDTDPFIDTVSFENEQIAGDTVTVPAELMRRIGFTGGEEVEATFEKVESLGDSRGAEETLDLSEAEEEAAELIEELEAEEDEDDELGPLFEDDEDEAVEEDEEEGLGELFG